MQSEQSGWSPTRGASAEHPVTLDSDEEAESDRSDEFAHEPPPDASDPGRSDSDLAEAKAESFSLLKAVGGWGALLDAGLPGVAFVIAFTLTDQDLQFALIVALALGALFAVIRLVRRNPLQNVISGFIGVALAAAIANATGEAEDFYLPGLVTNAVYLVGWAVANLLRYPLIGVVVGVTAGWGFEWRKDAVLLRAFTLVGWLWVVFFAVRLIVQVPLYLGEDLGALAVAKIAMGWPLWLMVLGGSYLIIKSTVSMDRWLAVKQAAQQVAERTQQRR